MTSGRLEFALFDKSADGWLAIEVYEQPLKAQSQDCVWTVEDTITSKSAGRSRTIHSCSCYFSWSSKAALASLKWFGDLRFGVLCISSTVLQPPQK